MFRFLKSLLALAIRSDRGAGHARRVRLGFETVEDRCTPGGCVWFDDPLLPTAASQSSQVQIVDLGHAAESPHHGPAVAL